MITLEPQITSQMTQWKKFLSQNQGVEFVWLQHMTYNGSILVQILPAAQFATLIEGQGLSLTKAVFHLLPGDALAEGALPTGTCYIRPDLSTLYRQTGSNSHRAVVMTSSYDENGTSIPECARSQLQNLTDKLVKGKGFSPLVGFEIEIVFMRRVRQDGKIVGYEMLDNNHSVFSMTTDDRSYMEMLEAIARALLEAGIAVQKFHAEAAPGQWEFVLPPDTPVKAADMLVKARDIIVDVADQHDLRATMYPRPSNTTAGNGMHTHISINPVAGQDAKYSESFFAGIMDHFPSVLAFNLAQDASYSRVNSGIWSGGEYAAWGWENKEAPLRRIATNRFEVKLVDGLANPYLALCGMLAAGIDGMERNLPLTGGDCNMSSAKLSIAEREALGITNLLPKTLSASLDALEADKAMTELVGPEIVSAYVAVKRGGIQHALSLSEEERRNYVISRY